MEYLERTPDCQYRDVLAQVVGRGELVPTTKGPAAYTLMQQQLRYELANGFPLIPDRDMSGFWRKPIGELCAFINGATTIAELTAFGCDWWAPWATAERTARFGIVSGDLGPGSYGGAFGHFPSGEPGGFDQFTHLVEQLRERPEIRSHFVTPWIPHYLARGAGRRPRATIVPCHGWVHVRVLGGRLHLHMFQRSGDLPIGVPSNMVQYGALTLMLAHLTGYPAAVYYHTISDAHIYADQVEQALELTGRTPLRLPTVTLNATGRDVTAITDFRAEHFDLADYHPHPAIRIPVAV